MRTREIKGGIWAVIVVLAVIVLYSADQVVQNLSLSRILTISDDIQETLVTYRDRRFALDDFMEENFRTLPDSQGYYTAQVALLAGQAVPPLGYSYDALQRVVVLPWHTRVRLARGVMTDHTDAWAGELDGYVQDPDTVFSTPYRSAIGATWRLLGPSFEEALPRFDLFGLSERIDAFVEEGQAQPRG